jgi:hypothetical protein
VVPFAGAGHIRLEKSLNAIEPFQDELIPCVKLYAGLSVDALAIEFSAKLAAWFGAVTTRLSSSTYLTLKSLSAGRCHMYKSYNVPQ